MIRSDKMISLQTGLTRRLVAGYFCRELAHEVRRKTPPRAVLDDPVTLRQAITELQAQLLAARAGLPAVDRGQHQHLHLHGLAPEQAAAIIAELQARHHPGGWEDAGSQ